MKKEVPIITHTEILSRAARSIELEIEDWERKAESLPSSAGMLDQVTKGLREKLEALRTLYRIETGSAKGENAVFTLDEAVSRIYELSAEAHMNMARNLKERRTWCEKNLKNYQTIKRAFEKVLDIRYAERLEVYRYYYGEGAAMRHSPHLREAAHTTITP